MSKYKVKFCACIALASRLIPECVHIKIWQLKINKKEFEKVKKLMPTERKPAKISNQQFFNTCYTVENGCKWRALPKKFGNWHTIYMRFRTALASRFTLMLPEPEKSVASKVLATQKGANNKN